jgi:hypothetical protein
MVKQFEIVEHFSVSIPKFFEYLIRSPSFEEQVHRARGNSKINITEWMCLGNDYWQRLCFYTMEEPDQKGLGNFTCMETQKYFYNGDTFRLDSTIAPDNPSVGNAFNIKSEWSLSKVYDDQCDLKIFVEVECKRNIIGFQGMIESTLAGKVRAAYEMWCQVALLKVKEEQEKQSEINIISTTKEFYEANRVRLHRRLKSIHHKVVSGTENIVRLFQDQTGLKVPDTEGNEPLLFDKEKESGEEGLVPLRDMEEGNIQNTYQPVIQPRKDKSSHGPGKTALLILCFLLLIFILVLYYF